MKISWENIKTILIIILLLFSLFSFISLQNKKSELKKSNHNIEVLNDSLNCIKTKYNTLIFEKKALILEKEEIEEFLDVSKKEIKRLEKELDDKISYISKIDMGVKIDSIETKDSIYIHNNDTIINFKYDDNWVNINGNTKIKDNSCNTVINNLKLTTPLKVGLTNNNTIFIESDCPYLYISNIEGATIQETKIEKKQRKIGFSMYLGMGVTYDIISRNFGMGPQLGFGIEYRIW